MRVHRIEDAPPPALAEALGRFENQFTYPLGPGRCFRISHGEDYPRFFRAIGGAGSAASFVAENKGEILGTLGVALRPVQLPGGKTVASAYLGDLKTAPGGCRAATFVALAAHAHAWAVERGAKAAYGVVMDGTPRSPSTYSGRLGIPAFAPAGKVCVLRLPAPSLAPEEDRAFETGAETVGNLYRSLSLGRFAPLGGVPEWRSCFAPLPLATPDGRACAILEDTRRAKRLMLDGDEMVSACLSQFAFSEPLAGAILIRQALARCARRALAPAMFVCVPEVDNDAFTRLLNDLHGMVHAPATIYATGFPPGCPWNVSSAEI